MKKHVVFCLFLIVLAFQACKEDVSTTNEGAKDGSVTTTVTTESPTNAKLVANIPTVAPPLKGIDVAYNAYDVDPAKGRRIEMDNGTVIEIPKNAFVDAAGNPVTDKVDIQYREFHTAADLIASGIPMGITDENGETGVLQTAGMFEIKGTSKGADVFIAPNKAVDVHMASFVNDKPYNKYSFDRETGNWTETGKSIPAPNQRKAEIKLEIKKLEKDEQRITESKPARFDAKKPVLDLDINIQDYPELKELEGFVWQYTGQDQSKDPLNNKWIFQESWPEIDIKPAQRPNRYTVTLSNDKKQFKTELTPSLQGPELEKAMAAYEKEAAKQKEIRRQRKNKVAQAKKQADIVRSFRVQGFGIYNSDIKGKQERMPLMADFNFGDESIAKEAIAVFLVTGDKRMVVNYPYYSWKSFSVDLKDGNCIVAVLPNNKVAVYSQKDFDRSKKELQAKRGSDYTFDLEILPAIESMKDLNKIINDIS